MSLVHSDLQRHDEATREALSLRVAELSSVCKQQRDELAEVKAVLDTQRKQLRDHEEIIRMQEGQLIERDAQLQAQNAEIRALRRQHALDAEALRVAHGEIAPKARPAGSPTSRAPRTPHSPPKLTGGSGGEVAALRRQLKQATHDKVVLVRALHQMTAEIAQARAEAKQHAAASERSMATAWKLGQLGLALLELGDEETPPIPDDASVSTTRAPAGPCTRPHARARLCACAWKCRCREAAMHARAHAHPHARTRSHAQVSHMSVATSSAATGSFREGRRWEQLLESTHATPSHGSSPPFVAGRGEMPRDARSDADIGELSDG